MSLLARIYRVLFWPPGAHHRGRPKQCEFCGSDMRPHRDDATLLLCSAFDGCEGVEQLGVDG